ncbi:hypothetical protein D3C87_1410120 [compost metagenome]|jgi:hypothetical protein|uniref:DUF4148 domain-containing protein n=1 Tax=Achromobacter TaxID=222 RepID=UPI000970E1F9|nr:MULTISPECIES: DUF4148 domain-containing protein [Achromobacter]
MRTRKSITSLIVTAAALGPAIAGASTTFEVTNDEIGVATHYAPSAVTREQVAQDLAAWKKRPFAADGWTLTDGEEGWTAAFGRGKAPGDRHSILSRTSHPHWQAVDGEAGWVNALGT